MSRDFDTMFGKLAAVGFFVILTVASGVADPVPGVLVEASSVATPLGSSQLVASTFDREEGLLGPEVPAEEPPALQADDTKKDGAPGGGAVTPPASEVGDMMRDPYHNDTLSTSDSDEEAAINNDTDIVSDSHVSPINKTHEEEASEASPLTPLAGGSLLVPTTEGSAVSEAATTLTLLAGGSSLAPTRDGSTVETSETETKEDNKHSETKSEETEVTEKGEISLAEVTSLPVGALVSEHDSHDHQLIGKTSSLDHTTQVAAILTGVLVLVSLMGYLGMLLWRRVLEGRYGNRQMLVNEDEDFKHFEL